MVTTIQINLTGNFRFKVATFVIYGGRGEMGTFFFKKTIFRSYE